MATTIADALTLLANNKAAIKQAIIDKGVSVSDNDALSTYASKIESISGGSIEDLITKENLVRIEVKFSNHDFTLDASNNFTDETSNPKFELLYLGYIKLIFLDLELDYYYSLSDDRVGPPPRDVKSNFVVVSGVEFSLLYTLIDDYYIHFTLYRNNEQIGYFIARYD